MAASPRPARPRDARLEVAAASTRSGVGAGENLTPHRRLRLTPGAVAEASGGRVEPGRVVVDRGPEEGVARRGALGRAEARALRARGVDQGAGAPDGIGA